MTARETLPGWQIATRLGILLGVVLVIAGVVVHDIQAQAFAEARWVASVLLIGGAVMTLACAAVNWGMFVRLLTGRHTLEGLNFGAVVLLAIALAGFLCYITNRWFVRMDWTGQRDYSLHSQTRNIVRSLDQDVTATILYSFSGSIDDATTAEWLDKTRDMLAEFRALTPRLTVEELNWSDENMLVRAKELGQKLGEEDLPGACVIFAGADSHKVVARDQAIEVRGQYQGGPGQSVFSGEDAYASALASLTEKKKATVYFLTGHGERTIEAKEQPQTPYGPPPPSQAASLETDPRSSLSRLAAELEKDNYEVKPLALAAAGSVPDDCAVLVIAGPKMPLQPQEMDAIRKYLNQRDGRAIIMVDTNLAPDVDSNIADLVADYGIRARTDAVGVQVVMSLFQGAVPQLATYVVGSGLADHPTTAGLRTMQLIFDQACPLEIEPPDRNSLASARPLLTGVEGSWGETKLDLGSRAGQTVKYNAGEDVSGPVVVAAVVQPGPPPGQPPMGLRPEDMPGPRLVVVGSSLAFMNGIVAGDGRANLYFMENCVNWLGGRQNRLGIPPKTEDLSPATVSEPQLAAAKYVFIGVLPACVIALGIAVLVMRRR